MEESLIVPVRPGLSLAGTISKKSILKWAVGAAIVVAISPFVGRLIYSLLYFESTDDAYVQAHIHTISPRIPGYVTKVMVLENQTVKKGEVLVKLDSQDVEPAIREAQASFSRSQKDVSRFRGYTDELNPMDRKVYDDYQASATVNDARLSRARLQYEYTNILAPEDGKIGRVSVETGDQIQTGQALMPLVELNPWIEANFKESQIANLRLGQEAEISVDSIPNQVFHGKVDSIAPGSGATFALLPPDNATGNFTKVVQRIPVKIVFDPQSVKGFEDRIVAGMSTEVRVRVR
jgi:membrane fusion protein (multidrug efflux system)